MSTTLVVDQIVGPFVSITSALSSIPFNVDDDYIVEVHEGDYNESVMINKNMGGYSIMLKGVYGNPEAVRVHIPGTTLNIQCENISVQDMFFDTELLPFSFYIAAKIGSESTGDPADHNITINRCKFYKTGGYYAISIGFGGTVVKNCVVTGNGVCTKIHNDSGNVKLYNNLFEHQAQLNAIDSGNNVVLDFYNNIVYSIEPNGILKFVDSSPTATFNADYNSYYAPQAISASWDVNNLIYADFSNYQSGGNEPNSFNIDPLFIDAGSKDFSLNESSPLVESGSNLISEGVITDYLGVVRPKNSIHDIGAHEIFIDPNKNISGNLFLIPTLTAFAGDKGEISLVWTRPNNATSTTLYEYNIIENYDPETNQGDENSWITLGTEDEILSTDLGTHLDGFIPYLISSLNNDSTYRVYVRAKSFEGLLPGKNPRVLSFGEDIYVDVTPRDFLDEEPNPKRLMRGLPDIFKAKEDHMSRLYQIFEKIAYHIRSFHADLIEQGLTQLNILTATDEFVDNWGILFNVDRQANETDAEYGARIVRTFTIEKATPGGIKKAVQPYSSQDVVLIEGSRNQNSFVFDSSYFDFDSYSPDLYIYQDLVPHTIDAVPSPEDIEDKSGQQFQVPPNSGNYEFLYGSEFGQGSGDSFLFVVRVNPIATGNPASIQNTIRVIHEIINTYKLAGTKYELEILE